MGFVFIALGLSGIFWVGRRRFYRRNMAGVEEFEGYGKAVATTVLEKLLNLICVVLTILGALALIKAYFS